MTLLLSPLYKLILFPELPEFPESASNLMAKRRAMNKKNSFIFRHWFKINNYFIYINYSYLHRSDTFLCHAVQEPTALSSAPSCRWWCSDLSSVRWACGLGCRSIRHLLSCRLPLLLPHLSGQTPASSRSPSIRQPLDMPTTSLEEHIHSNPNIEHLWKNHRKHSVA